jgi:hypothetical protein
MKPMITPERDHKDAPVVAESDSEISHAIDIDMNVSARSIPALAERTF